MPSQVDTCKIAESDLAMAISNLRGSRHFEPRSQRRQIAAQVALVLILKSARNIRKSFKITEVPQ